MMNKKTKRNLRMAVLGGTLALALIMPTLNAVVTDPPIVWSSVAVYPIVQKTIK